MKVEDTRSGNPYHSDETGQFTGPEGEGKTSSSSFDGKYEKIKAFDDYFSDYVNGLPEEKQRIINESRQDQYVAFKNKVKEIYNELLGKQTWQDFIVGGMSIYSKRDYVEYALKGYGEGSQEFQDTLTKFCRKYPEFQINCTHSSNVSHFSPTDKEVTIVPAFSSDDLEQVETAYHEVGHAYDFMLMNLKSDEDRFEITNQVIQFGAAPALSNTIKLQSADGLTLEESLKAEFNEEKLSEIKALREFWKNRNEENYDKILNNFIKSAQIQVSEEINRKYYNGEYKDVKEYKKALKEALANDPSIREAIQQYNDYKEIQEYSGDDWKELSDIVEGLSGGSESFGYGHGRKYWRFAGGNISYRKVAIEAFANIHSTLSNDKLAKRYALVEKFFPKSCNGVKELIEYIRKELGE